MMKLKTVLMSCTVAAALSLAACGGQNNVEAKAEKSAAKVQAVAVKTVSVNALDAAIADDLRADNKARDQFRNPKETLEFFGLKENMSVAEVWPGWYTEILAPYAKNTGGTYTGVLYGDSLGDWVPARNKRFTDKFGDEAKFGTVQTAGLAKDGLTMDENSVDLLVSFRNLHNWMGAGWTEEAMSEFYRVVKPGGTFGIVEHRLPESAEQDPRGGTGYVQESYMKTLAEEAGFEYVSSSEVNANPKDTADHPFGVWTLPPRSRTPEADAENAATFDAAKFKAIGESDRFTMKFRKPK